MLENKSKPIIEMLQNGSIDAWAYGDAAGIWLIQESGANASDYEIAFVLGQTDYYYAFNKETPDYIVQSFQQAIDYVKSNKDFAYDYEGRTLALPYQPKLVDTNRIDAQDPNGVKFIQQAIDTARMGNGFIYYIYPDSSRNMTQALKQLRERR